MRFVGEVRLGACLLAWPGSGQFWRCRSLRFLIRLPQVAMSHQAPARLKDAVDLDAVQADLASVIQQDWSPLTSRCGGTPAGKVPGAYGQIATRRST